MYKALLQRKAKKGQGLVEYALIIALIAVVLIGSLQGVQTSIAGVFGDINTALGAI